MNRVGNKASRLLQIEALLLGHPEGLTQAEIARRLNVHRSTINRYFPDLPSHIYVDLDGRWKVDRSVYLLNVRLNLHEAMALHLATRLLTTRMDRQNPHSAAALRKLAVALEKLTPTISQHLRHSADELDDGALRYDPNYLEVLEALTLAWGEQRRTRVYHRNTDGIFNTYQLDPYFIEPYAIGQSAHVIGWRTPPGRLRTLKIERIERVELLEERYAIPSEFDPAVLLADAWGIWYTEEEPVEVVLKFNPQSARRVRESRWHRSQRVEELPDGSLVWRARIAEPLEMLPWIRGWGADVEVLEPEGLREMLVKEVQRLMGIYNE